MFYYLFVFTPIIVGAFVIYYYLAKKKTGKKKAIFMGCSSYLFVFIGFCLISALFDVSVETTPTSQSNEQGSAEYVISGNKVNNTDSILDVMREKYTFKKDEFDANNRIWVIPKSAPKYRNNNGYYCYFQMNDKYASNFRLVIQYEADDWLFIEKFIFNVDGEIIEFVPHEMERDNDKGRIWEWCDEGISSENEELIRKISNAKTVKVKCSGKQYDDIRDISQKDLASIKETLKFYEDLGGTL